MCTGRLRAVTLRVALLTDLGHHSRLRLVARKCMTITSKAVAPEDTRLTFRVSCRRGDWEGKGVFSPSSLFGACQARCKSPGEPQRGERV